MIYNQWYVVLESKELRAQKPLRIKRFNENLVLWRDERGNRFDEENTIIYVRYYQNIVKVPVLKELFNYLWKLTNIIILRQDKRIVITQLPKKSELRMKGLFVPTSLRPIYC